MVRPYWDGGYSGNPTITPLVRECASHDTLLIAVNPVERLAEARWGGASLSAVAGVWAVVVALAARDPHANSGQSSAVAELARRHGCRYQRFCLAGLQCRQSGGLRLRRCDAARVFHRARLGCFQLKVVRWYRLQWRLTCSRPLPVRLRAV